MEEALFLVQGLVVVAVEGEGAPGVHRDGGGGVGERLALGLQLGGVGWVEGRVLVSFAGEVVEPVAEEVAVPDPNCVPT